MEISLTTWRPGRPQLILFVLYQPQFTVTKQSTSENTASRKLLPFGNIKFESETEKLSSHFQKRVIAYWKLLSFLPLDSVQNLRCTIRRWGPWQVLGNSVRSKDGRMWGARYGVDCIQCICKCLCRGLMTGGGIVVHYIGVVTPDTLYCEDWQWRMSTGTQTCHYQITKTENNKNTAICRAEFISKQDPNLNDRNER